MAYAFIGAAELPHAHIDEEGYEEIADAAYTAGVKYRRDSAGHKRVWSVESKWLTEAQKNAVRDEMTEADFGFVAFWHESFGATSSTIQAQVSFSRPISRNTQIPSFYDIGLTVREQ